MQEDMAEVESQTEFIFALFSREVGVENKQSFHLFWKVQNKEMIILLLFRSESDIEMVQDREGEVKFEK